MLYTAEGSIWYKMLALQQSTFIVRVAINLYAGACVCVCLCVSVRVYGGEDQLNNSISNCEVHLKYNVHSCTHRQLNMCVHIHTHSHWTVQYEAQ